MRGKFPNQTVSHAHLSKKWVIFLLLSCLVAVAIVSNVVWASLGDDFATAATAYSITYDANGGTITDTAPTAATEGQEVVLPNATKSGYKLMGWRDDGSTADYVPEGTRISTRAELAAITGSNQYYLACDIDLAGSDWTPISSFSGTLDGCGYSIKNMRIRATTQYIGLFAQAQGTIKNLNLVNVDIVSEYTSNSTTSYTRYVGGFVGYRSSTIIMDNCTISGSISATNTNTYVGTSSNYSYMRIGGLIGDGYGTMTNCTSNVTITSTAKAESSQAYVYSYIYIGGLVGSQSGALIIKNSNNTGSINGTTIGNYTGTSSTYAHAYSYVGGFIGYGSAGNLTITHGNNSGEIQGNASCTGYYVDDYAYVGGIIGCGGGNLTECYNTGKIIAVADLSSEESSFTAKSYSGGVFGYIDSTTSIKNCYNTGEIYANGNSEYTGTSSYNATSTSHSGGIIGYSTNTTRAENVYNIGYIKAESVATVGGSGGTTANGYSGGIIGYGNTNVRIFNLFNAGNVESITTAKTTTPNAYQICGYSSITMIDAYYLSSATATATNSGDNGAAAVDNRQTLVEKFMANIIVETGADWVYTAGSATYPTINIAITSTPAGENWIAISDRAGLAGISSNIYGKYYLTADINLNSSNWVPISSFYGVFDGCGYTISNMKITDSKLDYVGLFAQLYGTVRNVKLSGINISISYSGSNTSSTWGYFSTARYAGGITGYASGNAINIYNCSVAGSITVSCQASNNYSSSSGDTTGKSYVGGIIGYTSTITNINKCFSAITISSTGYGSSSYFNGYGRGYAGGILGFCSAVTTISGCYNTGNITSSATGYSGRSSYTSGSSTYNCYASGIAYSGGIVGYDSSKYATIVSCYNTGTISSTGAGSGGYASGTYRYGRGFSGGISGYGGVINKCFNIANISATGSGYDNSSSYGRRYQIEGNGGTYSGNWYLSSASAGSGNNGATNVASVTALAQNFYNAIDQTVASAKYAYNTSTSEYPVLKSENLTGKAGETKIFAGDANHRVVAQWIGINYTVKYHGNNATEGSTGDSLHIYGTPKNLTTNGFSRTGYTFAGWHTDPYATSILYTDGQSVSTLTTQNMGVVNLYAIWKTTITLDRQGAVYGATSATSFDRGNMTKVAAPTMMGWSFAGYFTEPCGGGIQYYNGNMESTHINDLVNGTKLYACWQSVINLDLQGGTGVTNVTATYNAPMPELAVPFRPGYSFGGYFSAINGQGTRYYNNNMTSACLNNLMSGSTIYAYWMINTYVIYYNGNGGVVNPSSQSITFGSNVTTPTPTRTGYTFFGWFVDGSRYDGGIWTYTENKTAIAKWGYTLTYNPNGGFVYPGSVALSDGDVVTPNVPTRLGCDFTGWKIDSADYYGGVWNFNSNKTAVAQWVCRLYATLSNGAEGTITGTANGYYAPDTSVSITANPASGYAFDYWMINGTKYTSAAYTVSITEYTQAIAYFKKTQPTANVYATNGSISNTYLNFEPETYSATLRISPEAGKYIAAISFDNVAYYTIDSWSTTLYASSAFAQNVAYRANEGNNDLWLTFNYYNTNKTVNVYVNLTTTPYSNLNVPKNNTGGGALDGIAVSANYGGSVTLVGADYEALADSDEIICTAKLAQEGYEFVGWVFVDSPSNILSTDESAKFTKSTIYGRQLMAKFQPTEDNPFYNMILNNQ